MDGNGRWAQSRGLSRSAGHKAGTEAAKAVVTSCRELGVRYLTLYTFSRENWKRPKDEIVFLFDLLVQFLKRELQSLMDQSIRLQVLGDIEELPFATRQVVKMVCSRTARNDKMTLNLALNYSGRDDILRACKELLRKQVAPKSLTEEMFAEHLFTAGQPDPDLIIRTSGELRLSNYLLFQAAYSEFYFTDVFWPDFDKGELMKALEHYGHRQRRFGLTGEQQKQQKNPT